MRKSFTVFLALFLVTISAHAQIDPPIRLIHTTFLPGYVGDFEHFAVDVKGNRLFLIAEDHKTVEVLDIHTGRRTRTITGFGQPHAIEYLAGPNSLIVTEGDEESGAVDLVSGSNYKILDKIKLPTDVDGGVYTNRSLSPGKVWRAGVFNRNRNGKDDAPRGRRYGSLGGLV